MSFLRSPEKTVRNAAKKIQNAFCARPSLSETLPAVLEGLDNSRRGKFSLKRMVDQLERMRRVGKNTDVEGVEVHTEKGDLTTRAWTDGINADVVVSSSEKAGSLYQFAHFEKPSSLRATVILIGEKRYTVLSKMRRFSGVEITRISHS